MSVDRSTRQWDRSEPGGTGVYHDRDRLATTEGVVRIEHVALVKVVDGDRQETVESHWRARCPACYATVESDDGSEDARAAFIDALLDHCEGVGWVPPFDYIEDCSICGESHRRRNECRSVSLRTGAARPETLEQRFECRRCYWSGPGTDLTGSRFECPSCGSDAVSERVVPLDVVEPEGSV